MCRTRFLQSSRIVLLAVFVVQLSACSYYDRYREDEWGPRALLNPAQIVPKSPRAAASISTEWSEAGARPSEYDQFYAIERALNHKGPADAEYDRLLQRYVDQGIALSNNVCDTWFNLLERAQANTQFWKNNSVITAATATTIMGAADAAAKEIAIVAAGFAGVNAGFENFQSTFLFTPNMQTVRKRIKASREEAVTQKFRGPGVHIATYEFAKAELMNYHQLCSGSEIKNLIQGAVDITEYKFNAESWTTKIRVAGSLPRSPTASIEKAMSEVLFARSTARKSFEGIRKNTHPDLAVAIKSFEGAHAAITAGWEVIQSSGNSPSAAAEDQIPNMLTVILGLKEQVDAVGALAKVRTNDKDLGEASQLLNRAHTDLLSVSEKLKALNKAYAVASAA